MLFGATQDRRVIVKSSDKMWSTGGGNGKLLQYSSYKDTMNIMKRQKERYDTKREGWKVSNTLQRKSGGQLLIGKNEVAGPKQKWHSVVDMSGGENKIRYC